MNVYEQLINKQAKLSIIGLGYVGLPIAIAFAKKVNVIGFDINQEKIDQLNQHIDVTKEVEVEDLRKTQALFTSDEKKLQEAKFHIVAVPTPIKDDKTPDLSPLESASQIVGRNLVKGSVVVFESTVYPGVTEEICVPILEKESKLVCGIDFKVGYSPERINPGDKVHRLETIVKVVSGMDSESLEAIAKVYELVVDAGVHKAPNIKVAEAAKVIENTQRDINIAFMNELSVIFNKMYINTRDVLEAAGTKWNFLNFQPGLVGGHCIGVDPYYLTFKAKELGIDPKIALAGRDINDHMAFHVASLVEEELSKNNSLSSIPNIGILGFTFKEDCPDTRNTKVYDLYQSLDGKGYNVYVSDPVADKDEVKTEYGIDLVKLYDLKALDVVIIAVAHQAFKRLENKEIDAMFNQNPHKFLFDLKSIFHPSKIDDTIKYLSL